MEYEFHTPVLLEETIDGLAIKKGKKYIDATLGGGGHGLAIVKRGGKVLGIDIDDEALEYVRRRWKIESGRLKIDEGRLRIVQGNFRDIGEIAKRNGFEKVAGIVFDLGVSLHQLTAGERGFSFLREGPLDMRMDKSLEVRAFDLVNGLYEHELALLFEKYGNEQLARRIAHVICLAREVKKIETTGELANIVGGVKRREGKTPALRRGRHPATKIFQALRIAVNDELGSLEQGLTQAMELLEPEGRIAVISFHSLEERIVKNIFGKDTLTKKPIEASEEEVQRNPKARSAKMRVYEKN